VAATGVGIASVPVGLEVIGRESLRKLVRTKLGGVPVGEELEKPAALPAFSRHVPSCPSRSPRVMGSVNADAGARAAGLLHDIGAWNPDGPPRRPWANHPRQGARLMRRSGLPDEICRAVASHHDSVETSSSDQATELTAVIMMADRVAHPRCA